jgi:hypothetical protein
VTPRVSCNSEHVSPDTTTCHSKQLPVVPGGVGAGGGTVVDGVLEFPALVEFQSPSRWTQYHKPVIRLKQLTSMDGLISSNKSTLTPAANEIRWHVSATCTW